jgi:hypothetical protein
MALRVTQYHPTASVAIYPERGLAPYPPHVVDRDLLQVTTSKNLGDPSGSWSLSFDYRPDAQGKTWADRLAPMDYVVIALARTPQQANAVETRTIDPATGNDSIGGNDTIVMRGFVDNVREAEGMGEDGKPQRQIVVNGRDWGKMLETTQVWYNPITNLSAMLQPDIQLEVDVGIKAGSYTPGALFALVLEKLVDRRLWKLSRGGAPYLPAAIGKDIFDDASFLVSSLGFQQFVGSVHDLLAQFGNAPWCEFYTEDRPAGPVVVLRWAPLLDATGALPPVAGTSIQATPPILHTLSRDDIVSISTARSDNEVYSYYFTYCSNAMYDTSEAVASSLTVDLGGGQWGQGQYLPFPNPYPDNGKIEKYGPRVLDVSTTWIPIASPNATGPSPDQIATAVQLACALNKWLVDVYNHNEELRNGELTIKGNNALRVGQYVRIADDRYGGRMVYYIEGVDHTWTLYQGYTTTLRVSRGQVVPAATIA